ncbi:pentapeptide repeat-containing protein [Massilia rubra]|uniref:Pentapeptide repeat-containing protein n=1 Tax=Massilia rubra TaxID=2607910 RepID=A0ABX0LLV9_9BURK|nr:pentapeptide repeat-containing protein [Massilia rubra]NHZ33451.1 pentapeptide repeat-containing protein [Massilia rubra]
MDSTDIASEVLAAYERGERCFQGLTICRESFEGQVLEDVVFQDCNLYVDFRHANLRNATFRNGGIKTCDFRDADLSGARFENVSVEGSQYARAKTDGVCWNNNWAYGSISTQDDFDSWIKGHEQ